MPETYDLTRFVAAQADVYAQALAELQAGAKRSHWMWFVFPQIVGLGTSPMARRYALVSLDEARAYLGHDLLGPRLRTCTETVNRLAERSAHAVFGSPDDMKFHSSMTLFARAAPDAPPFRTALATYFGGVEDRITLDRLGVA